jgi:hypothetical protein
MLSELHTTLNIGGIFGEVSQHQKVASWQDIKNISPRKDLHP